MTIFFSLKPNKLTPLKVSKLQYQLLENVLSIKMLGRNKVQLLFKRKKKRGCYKLLIYCVDIKWHKTQQVPVIARNWSFICLSFCHIHVINYGAFFNRSPPKQPRYVQTLIPKTLRRKPCCHTTKTPFFSKQIRNYIFTANYIYVFFSYFVFFSNSSRVTF